MTTNFAYADITALKGERADVAIVLRWVNSKLSWYQADPTATGTPDDDTVVQPTLGVGRWLKQYAAKGTSLTWLTLSASATVAVGNGYFVNTTGGAITATLPATAVTGSQIAFIFVSASSSVNSLTIDRNGRNINGGATNFSVFKQWEKYEFTYIDDATGWAVTDATTNVKVSALGSVISRPYSGILNQQNDIVDYLGTQLATLSYQDPTNGAGRTIRMRIASTECNATAVFADFTVTPFSRLASDSNLQTPISGDMPGFVVDFGIVSGSVRIDAMEFALLPSRVTNASGGWILFGSNEHPISGITTPADIPWNWGIVSGVNVNVGCRSMRLFKWEYINHIIGIAQGNYVLVSGLHRYAWTGINSSSFYRYIYIMPLGRYVNGSFSINTFLSQMHFYGDYRL